MDTSVAAAYKEIAAQERDLAELIARQVYHQIVTAGFRREDAEAVGDSEAVAVWDDFIDVLQIRRAVVRV
tara:strand:+ start:423 stop:632 length:210 start_codon:yes stop_codon:yes gene_type:complete